MHTIKGTFTNGVARPAEPVEGLDGRPVLITFLDAGEEPDEPSEPEINEGWDRLLALIERCQVNTGIGDLAHQHDHYIHGTPKKP